MLRVILKSVKNNLPSEAPNLNGTNKKNDYESYLSAVRCSYLELDFLFRYYFPYQSDIFHLSLCSSGLPIQGVFTERYVRS